MADALAEFPVIVELRVGARVATMESDRFRMEYLVFSDSQKAVAATGSGLIVSFDYGKQEKAELPAVVREKIRSLGGTLSP